MKKHHILLAVVLILSLTLSCQNNSNKAVMKASASVEYADMYYTCSMHPEVQSDKPGKCPKCGMELVEADNTKSDSTQLHQHSDSMHHNK